MPLRNASVTLEGDRLHLTAALEAGPEVTAETVLFLNEG